MKFCTFGHNAREENHIIANISESIDFRVYVVNGVVVWPWAQNRKIKSSSIAAALLIPHTC